ncbi:MAG: proton extrusion protein PcxA [Gloeocapsa sp. DLM2.Bin57]|nr:MAG: proton extrusion protein PcxA [Gloeocapsa sp. DLM2.Bin57]
MQFPNVINNTRQWLANKPYRALEEAYQSILIVKAIESDHFNNKKVSHNSSNYSESVLRYFDKEIKRHLNFAQVRLNEFQMSKAFSKINNAKQDPDNYEVLEKLKLIDYYLLRYRGISPLNLNTSLTVIKPKFESKANQTSVLPRSFLTTLKRLKQQIDPQSEQTEEQVLNKFRSSRYKAYISVRFFLLLIIIPLLTHQITKQFFIYPLVERYSVNHEEVLFLNYEYEEEAFRELQTYEERLHFQELMGTRSKLSEEQKEELLEIKAQEIAREYQNKGTNALANVFADLCSLIAFILMLVTSKKDIAVVKSFMDDVVYGLSDSAKAFLIILLTDIFVGYHSPHGWEIVLERIAEHLGLPENREFNYLFIATFPVILDTILKYWIFRYLNRISPSAVATYRNMNE